MLNIEERQQELIEEFSFYDDWMDKYGVIIDMGKELEPIPEEERKDENLIKGCQSKVWLIADREGDNVIYRADSDAIITKGLVSMLIKVLSDASMEDVVKSNLHFIEKIGLQEHLSPTRSNGLASMLKQMKLYALAYSAT
jgi:cysteine desulfuration protein SufE